MSARFATTPWTLVLEAASTNAPGAREALESLCSAYWYPLYAFVRRSGNDAASAEDLTQGFFAHLLDNDLIKAADPDKGRFRSFLLTCMKNYIGHEREKAGAAKRGQAVTVHMGDDAETRFAAEAEDLDPEELFHRRWALTVMEHAKSALVEDSNLDEERFAALWPLLTGGDPEDTYREIGERLGMSDGAVRVAVHRLRQQYGSLLREEIERTVADPSLVDDELRSALQAIGPAGGDL